MEVGLLRQRLKVLLTDENETVAKTYPVSDVTVIRRTKPQLKKRRDTEEE
jgi:hypothetical protein